MSQKTNIPLKTVDASRARSLGSRNQTHGVRRTPSK